VKCYASQWPRRAAALAAAVCLLVTAGCGDGAMTIQGAVTLDDTPVENGTISFDPADGNGPTLGGPINGGRYEVKAPAGAAGRKVVRIQCFRLTGKKIWPGPPSPPGTMVDETKQVVPPEYNEKSTLTADLVAGKPATLDYKLSAK